MSLAPRPVGWQRDRVQTSLSSVLDTGPGASVILCTGDRYDSNLVDPASSHMLVSKIKPCMSQYKLLYGETANGSLKQL
jgi:hypothetical protein